MGEIREEKMPGTVSSEADTPKSYLVDTPSGPIQRNLINLNPKPETEANCELCCSYGSTQQDPNSQPLTWSPIKNQINERHSNYSTREIDLFLLTLFLRKGDVE